MGFCLVFLLVHAELSSFLDIRLLGKEHWARGQFSVMLAPRHEFTRKQTTEELENSFF